MNKPIEFRRFRHAKAMAARKFSSIRVATKQNGLIATRKPKESC